MEVHPDTAAVTAGRPAGPGAPLNAPLVPASTYRFGESIEYARFGNSGWTALEAAVGVLEGGDAVAFGSGLAATSAVLDTLETGSVVVAHRALYHGVGDQLRRRADRGLLDVRWVDLTDPAAASRAVPGAVLVWAETPSNPLIEITDLAALAEQVAAHGARLVVDSTFASPLLQRPLHAGADVVVHSATKLIGGHSDLLLGLAVTSNAQLADELRVRRHDDGAVPGSLEAFLALRGLRTLPVRLARMQATAQELAARLSAHDAVTRVRYPGLPDDPGHALAARQMTGFGSMLSFETVGEAETADAVIERLRLVVPATSLGGVETLAERRGRYPAEAERGTPPTLIRLSVGLEHVDDLWADLSPALDSVVDNG